MSDIIIAKREVCNLPGKGLVDLLYFHEDKVLLISAQAIGLYQSRAAVEDPLGNGVLGYEIIPENLQATADEQGSVVQEQRAGYVKLNSGAVVFIRPDGVALYDDGPSALRNLNMHFLIPFS